MEAEQKVGAVQLSARLRCVSPPVIRRLLITEQSSLAELHATLQVSFGWSDQHLHCFHRLSGEDRIGSFAGIEASMRGVAFALVECAKTWADNHPVRQEFLDHVHR
jgi:Plasmid pRiA4b ORF-3-like protein